MNKWVASFFLAVVAALVVLALTLKGAMGLKALIYGSDEVFSRPISEIKHSKLNYGVYDPRFEPDENRQFANAKRIAIEHIFISWLDFDPLYLSRMHQYASERNRWLLVTVEPYAKVKATPPERHLDQIISGSYDSVISSVCDSLGKLKTPLFIRWGHEMERYQERYPWSGQSPGKFISAYQHFVKSCRKSVEEAYYVWSPLGDGRLVHYWPNDDFVDYVGLSVYSLFDRNPTIDSRSPSFMEVFEPKYKLASLYERPIMIAELGVAGDPAYQEWWLRGLFRNTEKFPLLKTVVYFNSKDNPGVWGNLGYTPDWRISGGVFE
jgi:beta-mannanase